MAFYKGTEYPYTDFHSQKPKPKAMAFLSQWLPSVIPGDAYEIDEDDEEFVNPGDEDDE